MPIQVDDPQVLVALITSVGAVVIAIFKDRLFRAQKRDEKYEDIQKQIQSLELKVNNELSQVKVKVDLFWRMVEQHVPKLLMQPTHKERDALLRKLQMGIITKDELFRLRDMLSDDLEQEKEKPRPEDRDMSKAFLTMLTLARIEQRIRGVA